MIRPAMHGVHVDGKRCLADQGLSLDAALAAVKAARPCALPNEGFLRQLRHYAAEQ